MPRAEGIKRHLVEQFVAKPGERKVISLYTTLPVQYADRNNR